MTTSNTSLTSDAPTTSRSIVKSAETRLSAVLSVLAGFVGAAAFTHSDGYFVTFMTGNTERAVLGWFSGDTWLAIGAIVLISTFVMGVIVGSLGRRFIWRNRAHGATALTTAALILATLTDISTWGRFSPSLGLIPIAFVAFAMGALNTSFVKNGEVSVPLSYVTGTVVKLGQGIERHMTGGTAAEWLPYAILYVSFLIGAVAGGLISAIVGGGLMLVCASIASALTNLYTYRRTR